MNRVPQVSVALMAALALPPTGQAQSLADQIAAVDLVQARQKAAQQVAIEAQVREERRVEERRHAEMLAAHRAQLEAQTQIAIAARVRAEQAAEEARARVAEEAADKKRDQNHEDKLRELDIETKKLQLEAIKTRVSRENDYIDRDLQRQSAETDIIQSHADSNRNLSSGMKSLLEKTGEAEVRAASSTTSTTILDLSNGKGLQQISR